MAHSTGKGRNKKAKHEEHENHERWLVSYADFITLLFAFFVVMYATSTSNEPKQKDFEESIKKQLHIITMGGQGSKGSKDSISEALAELTTQVEGFPRRGGPAETADYVDRALDKSMGSGQKKEAIQNVTHDSVGARVALTSSTFFQSGSAKLKYNALSSLDRVAEVLKSHDRRIIVEGHTDDSPISDSQYPSNWELAGARSTAVVRYLIKVHKINPHRLVSISYGDQKPLAPNDSEDNRAKNRRIEILIVTDDNKAQL